MIAEDQYALLGRHWPAGWVVEAFCSMLATLWTIWGRIESQGHVLTGKKSHVFEQSVIVRVAIVRESSTLLRYCELTSNSSSSMYLNSC